MAVTSSAKKALRQSLRKKEGNRKIKDDLKKILKEISVLTLQKKVKEAKEILPKVYKTIDKAAKSGVIKKNTAGRKKSRIAKSISRIK